MHAQDNFIFPEILLFKTLFLLIIKPILLYRPADCTPPLNVRQFGKNNGVFAKSIIPGPWKWAFGNPQFTCNLYGSCNSGVNPASVKGMPCELYIVKVEQIITYSTSRTSHGIAYPKRLHAKTWRLQGDSNGKTAFCHILQDDTSHGKTTLTALCLIMVQVMVYDRQHCVQQYDVSNGKTTLTILCLRMVQVIMYARQHCPTG